MGGTRVEHWLRLAGGVVVGLTLLLTACSPRGEDRPAPEPTPPVSWIGMNPGDARTFTGDAGELTLIYVDETYSVDGVNASALTYELDDTYVTDYFVESDGDLQWYGRRGQWRAGRHGETPRDVALVDDTAVFGDITLTLSEDGPTEIETPDGRFVAD